MTHQEYMDNQKKNVQPQKINIVRKPKETEV
eukprot:CAMPEP_0114596818 /NCGR_PEP_ID=MMETSP0125-20121206/18998_1 /TAXON_ID=485358 ORGANISM="Aristerostoma sp., Strain ATCC 50986" /NCGR_SAMPLE_ID=MMETSP0125 /ASSEMBLY_ACC=CAM_ASM_000245 /LENGTH=30 /DNA_ID= /DNA_START= /DNA_END= /DNA_ORIENTATION=